MGHGKGWKAMVVDDHELIRFAVTTMVEHEDICRVVAQASNGREAVEQAMRLGAGGLDVILMDVQMPVMTGPEATAKIMEALPSVRIIGLSMFQDAPTLEDMIVAGARSYVEKTESREELRRVIERTMAGMVYFPPGASASLLRMLRTPGEFGGHRFAPREFETLRLAAAGFSVKETASAMKIGEATVRGYRKAIAAKTGYSGRRGLQLFYSSNVTGAASG
jgi:NarL family two-component system response regulator LiaR